MPTYREESAGGERPRRTWNAVHNKSKTFSILKYRPNDVRLYCSKEGERSYGSKSHIFINDNCYTAVQVAEIIQTLQEFLHRENPNDGYTA